MLAALVLLLTLLRIPFAAFEDCTIRIDGYAPGYLIVAVEHYNDLPDELRMPTDTTDCY